MKECASHHAKAALSSTNLHTASVTVTDPLHQTRRDRSSVARALGRRFCVRSDDFFCDTPSCKSIFRIWNEPWASSFQWQEHVLGPSPFLNHSLDFSLHFVIKTSVARTLAIGWVYGNDSDVDGGCFFYCIFDQIMIKPWWNIQELQCDTLGNGRRSDLRRTDWL